MKYKEYNDNELLSYVAENNEDANNIIFEKYKPFIVATAKKMYNSCKYNGIEINDLIQEGMLGLNLALTYFSDSKNTSFYTFAKTCIERKMYSLVVSSKRLKHRILNDSLSLESNDKDGIIVNIEEIVGSSEKDPFALIINKEQEKELIEKIKKVLTAFEEQVFMLKINNFDYLEIASLLGKSPKSIDNALQRIKSKVKKICYNY